MRQLINKEDLKGNNVVGKWVVQLNKEKENVDFIKENHDGFWLEKRISYIGRIDLLGNHVLKPEYADQKESLIILNGIYYCHGIYTQEEFVDWFNDCSPTYNKEGKGRFLRFLTNRELDWLNECLKRKD